MPRLALELPTIQNWSCHNCSGCCRQHAIFITPEERARISAQNWTPADGVAAGQPLFEEEPSWPSLRRRTRLAHQPDGACVFLNEQGLCRIHAKFGEAAKPLACRIYPYAFHPCGERLTVSLRFSCPSVAANRGRSLLSQKRDLQELAQLVVPSTYRGAPPPPLTGRVTLDWPDTLRVNRALDESLAVEDIPVALKLLRTLSWVELLSQARFDKIQGKRLEELLALLREASLAEVTRLPDIPGPPSSVAQSQFRLLAGQYARQDTFASIDRSWRGRWRQLGHALQLARGRGNLPALHPDLKAIPCDQLEVPCGGLPAESEELLTRYFRVKIQGLHYCGAAYYGVPVVEGFWSLALVMPVVCWVARWRAASQDRDRLTAEDVVWALTIVDHQHGYSEAFGSWGFRRRVRNLAATGDLQKLIVWYQQ